MRHDGGPDVGAVYVGSAGNKDSTYGIPSNNNNSRINARLRQRMEGPTYSMVDRALITSENTRSSIARLPDGIILG